MPEPIQTQAGDVLKLHRNSGVVDVLKTFAAGETFAPTFATKAAELPPVPKPAFIAAKPDGTRLALTWPKVACDGYRVRRNDVRMTPAEKYDSSDELALWPAILPGTYTVTACVGERESEPASVTYTPTVPPIVVPPVQPGGVMLAPGGDVFAGAVTSAGQGVTLLLERGATYDVPSGKVARVKSHNVTIASYGDPSKGRPKVRTRGGAGVWVENVNGFTLRGVELIGFATPTEDGCGVVFRDSSGGKVEDCAISGYREAVQVQGVRRDVAGCTIERNAIYDNWTPGDKSQGVYASKVDDLVIRSNVFDRNGFQKGRAIADDDSPKNHTIYVQGNCNRLVVTDNLIANSASHGLQARCGGTIARNVFYNNPIHLSVGHVVGAAPKPGGVTADVFGNIFIGGGDIDGVERTWGITIGNALDVNVHDNTFVHMARGTVPTITVEKCRDVTAQGELAPGKQKIRIADNVAWDVRPGQFVRVDGGFAVDMAKAVSEPAKKPDLRATIDAAFLSEALKSPATAAADGLARVRKAAA